ncbi:MAG: PRC-barrel domain-containing protein [Alphaproteobacteria bacterium]
MATTNAATDAEMARPLASDPSIDEKELVGKGVRNMQGEELGDVEDVATQSADLKKYVVVGHGGVLGIGEKEIAVPFDKAKLSPDGRIVYVDLSVTQLEQAPSFDSGDRQWLQDKSWLERNTEFLNSGESDETTKPAPTTN